MAVVDIRHNSGLTPSKIVKPMDEQSHVEQVISRMPYGMKNVILLRNREHLTFADVGARLGASPEAARKLWARAIERLQEVMVQDHERRLL
jgi:RNA polymerase sigma-70 factor, ECF subfamily